MKKTRKELLTDAKLIGFNVKPYKWWFMSRKKLERLAKEWQVLIDFRKNGGTEIEWTVPPRILKANEVYATYLNDNISATKRGKWKENEN